MPFPAVRRRLLALVIAPVLAVGLVSGTAPGTEAANADSSGGRHVTAFANSAKSHSAKHKKKKHKKKKHKKSKKTRQVRRAVIRDRDTGKVIKQSKAADWQLLFKDDFTSSKLKPEWIRYEGVPGGDPAGQFANSHLALGGGQLALRGYRDRRYGNKFVTAGVSAGHGNVPQTFGKYEVRMRMDNGKGVGYVALLWPMRGGWPPEVDFAEDNGVPGRKLMTTSVHWKTAGTPHGKIYRRAPVDMRRWHTIGVEWRPNQLTYTVDGRPWAQVNSRWVPKVPMRLALQTQAWFCGHSWEACPDASTPKRVDMHIDWVRIYKLARAPR